MLYNGSRLISNVLGGSVFFFSELVPFVLTLLLSFKSLWESAISIVLFSSFLKNSAKTYILMIETLLQEKRLCIVVMTTKVQSCLGRHT